MTKPNLITVTAATVAKTGFFCKMSARGKPGYEQKLAWLRDRFAEGLEMRLLGGGERGFVEFIPGTHAWRAIDDAADYMAIHCLWVVGRSKGHGFSTVLLDEVEACARAQGFKGVAAVTSSQHWLIDARPLKRRGYEAVDRVEPCFDLLVRRFDDSAPLPRFCDGWADKLAARPDGLVVYRTAQCPYLDDAAGHARAYADDAGLAFDEVVLDSPAAVRARSPSPYGVFALVLNGTLLSYHYLLKKQIAERAAKLAAA